MSQGSIVRSIAFDARQSVVASTVTASARDKHCCPIPARVEVLQVAALSVFVAACNEFEPLLISVHPGALAWVEA